MARPDSALLGANSRPATNIRTSYVWLEVARCQTPSMITTRTSHVPFTELPSEALMLLSLFAMGAAAHHMQQRPKQSELTPLLEIIWNRNRLCLSDFADHRRMTAMLKAELSSLCIAGGVQ